MSLVLLFSIIFFLSLYYSKNKKIVTKSKAFENINLAFRPNQIKASQNQGFTVTLEISSNNPITIQLYQINIFFDKENVEVKNEGIEYLVGKPSENLGAHRNNDINFINNSGLIKIYGEIVDPINGLIINKPTEVAKITFLSKTNASYQVLSRNSGIIKVNDNYELELVNFLDSSLTINEYTSPEISLPPSPTATLEPQKPSPTPNINPSPTITTAPGQPSPTQQIDPSPIASIKPIFTPSPTPNPNSSPTATTAPKQPSITPKVIPSLSLTRAPTRKITPRKNITFAPLPTIAKSNIK